MQAKVNQRFEEEQYRCYVTDYLFTITKNTAKRFDEAGQYYGKSYREIRHPKPPVEIPDARKLVNERINTLGIKVVSKTESI